jgi:hypothetical protein
LGFTVSNAGVPAVTVNPFGSEATSLPVVAVTVRAPVAADDAIEILAVSLVALATVTLLTVTPVPKLTCVVF